MTRTILLALLLLCVGCSFGVHSPPHVVCHSRSGCLSDDDLAAALWTFHDVAAAAFDPEEDLAVFWYPDEMVFWNTEDRSVVGYTDSTEAVHVTSLRVLVHEVMHVHLWRMFPDYAGDADHEAGGGPWTEATNEAVRDVVSRLESNQ